MSKEEKDDSKSYYNYYSVKEASDTLSICQLVRIFATPDEICSVIAELMGIVEWSQTFKSPNIEIDKLDPKNPVLAKRVAKSSRQAILKNMSNCTYDTIIINDWIDTIESVKNGLVYRYDFEYFANTVISESKQKKLLIGLITSQKIDDSDGNKNNTFFDNSKSTIGNDYYGHSLSWCLDRSTSYEHGSLTGHKFLYRYKQVKSSCDPHDYNEMNWKLFQTIGNGNTITIEINFQTNTFGVMCRSFKPNRLTVSNEKKHLARPNGIPLYSCTIPKRLLKHKLPMTIGITFDHDQNECTTVDCAIGIKPR